MRLKVLVFLNKIGNNFFKLLKHLNSIPESRLKTLFKVEYNC